MFPPFFQVVSADIAVQALLGSTPCRVVPFGEVPAKMQKPYVAYSFTTSPENTLSCAPDIDSHAIRVEFVGDSGSSVVDAARAIQVAVEPFAHVLSYSLLGRAPSTRDYLLVMEIDWVHKRD